MAYDDPKLPRASLRGEQLHLDGENEPYFRDPKYRVYLEVTDLQISGGFEAEDFGESGSPKQQGPTLRGRVKLESRDKFAVAGVQSDPSLPIEFHLKCVTENEVKFHWRATIGFQMHDWEFEHEERFWVQAYCTGQPFNAIVAAVRTGRVEKLRVGMETTLWTKHKSSGFMPGMPMTFHLAPPVDRESTQPSLEHGTIKSITWNESYRPKPTDGAGQVPASTPADASPPMIANPRTTSYAYFSEAVRSAATGLGLELVPIAAERAGDIERELSAVAQMPNCGLMLLPDQGENRYRNLYVDFAARHRLPAIYPNRSFVSAGGLMSYVIDRAETFRQGASYVDRILRGEWPANLPIQAPVKYETVLNLKAAKELGLRVPSVLLATADGVIE